MVIYKFYLGDIYRYCINCISLSNIQIVHVGAITEGNDPQLSTINSSYILLEVSDAITECFFAFS
jgi:hypothetical protein